MPITFGGKSVEDIVADQYEDTWGAGQLNDPLPMCTSYSQAELLGMFSDYTGWIEQYLSEMAALARKQWRLQQKLKDPSLQESPGLGAARQRNKQYTSDLARYASDIAEVEAHCDRMWQAMTEVSRSQYSMDWNTPAWKDRLIGMAWLVKAPAYRWPSDYAIQIQAFRSLDPYLRKKLEESIGPDPLWLGKRTEW